MSNSADARIAASRLLKSCATPPASWPTASSRCERRSASCSSASRASFVHASVTSLISPSRPSTADRVADVERREAQAGVADRTVGVAQPQRRLADLLGLETRQARPVRVGRAPVVGVDERREPTRRRERVERMTEEVGAVQHLATAGRGIEQHDDVGRVAQDRAEPLFRRAQLGLDDALLLERAVERLVLDAEVLHRVVAARDRDRRQRSRARSAASRRGARAPATRCRRGRPPAVPPARGGSRRCPPNETGWFQRVSPGTAAALPSTNRGGVARRRRARTAPRPTRCGSVTSRYTAACPCAASAAKPSSEPRRSDRAATSVDDALGTSAAPAFVSRCVSPTRAAIARRAAGERDERDAGERRVRLHVGPEHGDEPLRIEPARRDHTVGGREHLVDRRHQVLHAEQRLGRGPVDAAPVEATRRRCARPRTTRPSR